MTLRRRAHLLLPSPLGVVEYDVLEDTVFVGPAARGGLTAGPLPFKEAVAALTADAEGAYAVKALPGEATPVVNGEPGDGRTLADGDKVALGERTFVFRTSRRGGSTRVSGPAAPAAPRTQGKGKTGRKRTTRMRANPWVTAVALSGALLLLVGLYLAIDRLSSLRADESVRSYVPEPPAAPEEGAARLDPAAQAYEQVARYEAEHPEDVSGAIERYRDHLRRFPASPEADRARARMRELYDAAAAAELADLKQEIEQRIRDEQFATALASIRSFERRFGATASGEEVAALRRRVREAARASLDALLAKVGPMVGTNPRLAHRALLAASPEYPPDLAGEITGLMERAIALMKTRGAPPPEPHEPRKPPPVEPGHPPGDAPTKPPGEDGGGRPTPPGEVFTEAGAFAQWKDAYAALTGAHYREALDGYSLLVLRYGDTETVRQNQKRIAAGRFAAKVGVEGPAGLLSVPYEEKHGRIEVEYGFDDARVVQQDFSVEQPFPSERPVTWEPHQGAIRLSNTTGLFHVLVWEPDVRLEARVVAEVAHDFGILAVDDTDEYRAVMLDVNNTLFQLKKGAAARPNPGHLLWFMGQGVWADADADAVGYIKIAERTTVKIQNADRVTMEMIRKGDDCEAGFHGRTDGVDLRGKVRGDDGGGLGSARLGLFVNTGIIVVEELKISGKVDMKWFARYLATLVDGVRGPED